MAGRIKGDLPDRSFEFAVAVLNAIDELPEGTKGWVVGKQLARSGTSIGANVREAAEALTDSDFAYKCSVARKEASETEYWLMLCERTGLLGSQVCEPLAREADELTRILATIVQKTHYHISSK